MLRRGFLSRAALAGLGLGAARRVAAEGNGAPTRPINLEMSLLEIPGPPQVNRIPSGDILFRITVVLNVTGDLTGKLTERVIQVHPENEEDSMPIATLWKLETADGTMEGHYSGVYEKTADGSFLVIQAGEVFSVTRAYGHLYRADIVYMVNLSADQSAVSGKMTIRKR